MKKPTHGLAPRIRLRWPHGLNEHPYLEGNSPGGHRSADRHYRLVSLTDADVVAYFLHGVALPGWDEISAFAAGETVVEQPQPPEAPYLTREVPVETSKTKTFSVSGHDGYVGERAEATVQEKYVELLRAKGHEVVTLELRGGRGKCDVFDKGTIPYRLTEVKQHGTLTAVRHAYGQLIWYADIAEAEYGALTLVACFGEKPHDDDVLWLRRRGVTVVWLDGDVFVGVSPMVVAA